MSTAIRTIIVIGPNVAIFTSSAVLQCSVYVLLWSHYIQGKLFLWSAFFRWKSRNWQECIAGCLPDVLDCKFNRLKFDSLVQQDEGSFFDLHSQHFLRLITVCLAFVYTTRTNITAHVKDPMSTFRQEKAQLPVTRKHTHIAHYFSRILKVMTVVTLNGRIRRTVYSFTKNTQEIKENAF